MWYRGSNPGYPMWTPMTQLGEHFMITRGSIFRHCTWKRKEIGRINA
ncbi:hypothetical protein LEMLEM_LOCUS21604 [Lemmus lemmus]